MLKLTLYLTSAIGILGNALVTPALAALQLDFPNVDPLYIRFIITVSSLFILPSALLANTFAKRFGNKTVLLSGVLLFGLAGISTAFLSNIYAILVSRAFLGLAMGLITPMSQSYPTYLFTGEEKNTVLARQGATISLSNCICSVLAGILAAISWRYAFGIYALAFIVFAIGFVTLPQIGKEDKSIVQENQKEATSIPKNVYMNLFGIFIYMICLYILLTNLALLIHEKSLGSPALSGSIIAMINFCSFLVGFNLNKIIKLFGRYTIFAALVSMTLTFYCMAIAESIAFMIFSGIISALFMGSIMSFNNINISKKVEKKQLIKVLSTQMVFLSLGQFASPIIFHALPTYAGYGEIEGRFFSMAAIGFACTLVLFFYLLFTQKQRKQKKTNQS